MKVVYRNVADLNPADYNPRKLTDEKKTEILESLTKYGMIVPIVVNINPKRKDIIIGGHQRVKVWKEMGNTEVPCLELDLSKPKEKELNMRLNVTGDWDYDIMAEYYSKDETEGYGLTKEEQKLYKEAVNPPKRQDKKKKDFDKVLQLELTEETYNLWHKWCDRLKEELGYDNPSKAFEFAIIEAINTPVDNWQK